MKRIRILLVLFVVVFQGYSQTIELNCSGVSVISNSKLANDSTVSVMVTVKNNSMEAIYLPKMNKGYLFGSTCFINLGSVLSKPTGVNVSGVVHLISLEPNSDLSITFQFNLTELNNVKDTRLGIDFIRHQDLRKKDMKRLLVNAEEYYDYYRYAIGVFPSPKALWH